MEGLVGGNIKKMDLGNLRNMMIMVNLKVFIDGIIVTCNNAMLLVLMIKLLHLDG
jgi:hypothetical protein